MTRKNYPKKLIFQIFNRNDNPFGTRKCWHCGKQLVFNHRKISDGRGAWHVDHFPVPHKDIESQYCCGITDTLEPKNLVPSCVNCNISHKFESSKWYFCNRSQICCTKKCVYQIYIFLLCAVFFFIGYNLGLARN